MAKHRALIIGAGRMGAGYPDPRKWSERYPYTHAEAYLALKDRVELVGFVEPDEGRAHVAQRHFGASTWRAPAFNELVLQSLQPTVISICTPPEERERIFQTICAYLIHGGTPMPAVWCEKPYGLTTSNWPFKVQVNYIRRFDPEHQRTRSFIKSGPFKEWALMVWAKADVHTVCHFTDLMRFWGVAKDALCYQRIDGPCSYVLRAAVDRTGLPEDTGALFWDRLYPLGGIPDGSPFMQNALTNLLDAVDGKAELISPPENAIESEKWAKEILDG